MQVLVWRERWAGAGRVSDAATDTILSTRAGEVWCLAMWLLQTL